MNKLVLAIAAILATSGCATGYSSPGGVLRAVAPSGSSFRFQAFAVTVDNTTNDGFLNMFAEHDP